MAQKKIVNKTPEINQGEVVEIFACGGQCRGQNAMPYFDTEETTVLMIKVG